MTSASRPTCRATPRSALLRLARGAALLAGILVAIASCSKDQAARPEGEAFEIEKKFTRGPVTLVVKVSRKSITIADRVTLVLEATADEDQEVELPKFGEKLEQFGIVDYAASPPRLVGEGRVVVRKSYELEPFLSGDYAIPPMKVRFWEKGTEDPKKHELETEELTVKVASILPEKLSELAIRDIAGPVDLPPPDRRWAYAVVGGGVAVIALAAALVMWLRRRGRGPLAIPRIPAHVLAYRRLERLLAEKLVEEGQVKLFYFRLSDVVRHYIEDRFGLHAPERTTEEFLDELRGSSVLDARFAAPLDEFLRHCDLVKFAEHQPTNADIQTTFDACKEFIEATRADDATVEAPEAAA